MHTIHAKFENGVFKPMGVIELPEAARLNLSRRSLAMLLRR